MATAKKKSNAEAYEDAVFFQETRKKNKAARKYTADIKTNLRNAGYDAGKVSIGYSERGRARGPQMLYSDAPGLGRFTFSPINKSNAKKTAESILKMKQNSRPTGRSTNKKAK